MNNNPTIPYDILLDKYLEAQRDIEYLEYKISSLNEELDTWQKAYEDYADILMEHGLI
ncbi:MAG: hypothetical protein J6A94_06950 [Lachnospiraceae bacterium]|nr:hypothetical protein [Lachnospiraceae bacterium]